MIRAVWRLLWRTVALLFVLLLCYQAWIALHIWWWVDHNPSTSAFMESSLEAMQSRKADAEVEHYWVPYPQISDNLKRALIAAEDAKFMDHEGFDWEGIQKAYEKNRKKGRIVAGGSTISQQLAKNLFLSTKRTPWRKAEEALITIMLEAILNKRRIFEIYLNIIEWGNGVFGAEAAARHYYQVGADQLSPEQAAQLAAMVPDPRRYDKYRASPRLARRTQMVLDRMDDAEIP